MPGDNKMILGDERMNGSGNLPPYGRTEEWHTTLLELQAHLAQRSEHRQDTDNVQQRSKEDEVQEAYVQVTLRNLGTIISRPDAKRILNDWADILMSGSEEQKELVVAALEKCLPLLLDAPVKYVGNIIAAAGASISGEENSNTEADFDYQESPAEERSLQDPPLPDLSSESTPQIMPPYLGTSATVPQLEFNERAWNATLQQLQKKVHDVQKGKKNGKFSSSVLDVVDTMVKLASLHPDPEVKNELIEQAKRIETASDRERENILKGLGKGVGLMILTPFALVGAAVFATGTMFYGFGKIIIGMGHVLTFGRLRK